jgi:AcrR family transcriptional regulator
MSPRPSLEHIRRPQILDAATRLLQRDGFHDVRMDEIAQDAGVSPAMVLHYFDSRDRLLEETLAHADDMFYAALMQELSEIDDPVDKLVRVIERSSAPAPELDDWRLWMEMWVRALHSEHARAAYERMDRRLRGVMKDIITEGQASGEFAPAPADDVALSLNAIMSGYAVQVTLGNVDVPVEQMTANCLGVASMLLEVDLSARAARGTRRPRRKAVP